MSDPPVKFDSKIAIVIRSDLESWQMLNVAAFLASGITAAYPDCVGEPYEDASGTRYHALIGQPILIYAANVKAAVYSEEMFTTTHDAANRGAVRAVQRPDLNLVGLAFRADRKVIDKVVDGLKFHK